MFENEGLGETTQETEVTPESTESAQVTAPEGQPQASELLDLDSVEKFRYGGREWTPKDFRGAQMMQADYTRKTQEIAQERKYYDNLSHDLERVKANPQLAAEFKKIYPEKFHGYLGYVSSSPQTQARQPQGQQQQGQAQPGKAYDPELMNRIERIEADYKERKLEAIDKQLDAVFESMGKKYPMADQEAVIARAQAMLDRGEKLTDESWDKVFKSVHDVIQKKSDEYQSKKVQGQMSVNQRGKDAGAGGGLPGRAPNLPRTIKEAAALAEAELNRS